MQNTSRTYARSTRTNDVLPWKWIGIIGGIILLLIGIKIFGGGSNTNTDEAYLTVTPGADSAVYISMTTASKSRITEEKKLYASDKSLSVEAGSALAKNESMHIDIDKGSEISYKSHSSTGDILSLTKGHIWIDTITNPVDVELKNYTVTLTPGSTALLEQVGPYSNLYILEQSATISTEKGNTEIQAGSMISLLKSDLLSPSTKLTDWIHPIEGSILEYPLFTRNQGSTLLGKVSSMSGNTLSGTNNQSGTLIGSGSIPTPGNVIEIIDPKMGTMVKTKTITIMGKILSKDVKRVTLNNVEATVSPVNETFSLKDVPVTATTFDIVYKAYDSNNTPLQTGVLSLYADKNIINSSTTLVPETFPVSSKSFKITSPAGNPYSTTESLVKVQGVIPAGSVEYIMVNDYRLQKFTPKSSTWYYFANMANGTMKNGFNLYTIKFYGANNTLLYSLPFTIIKESKNGTTSGE